MPAYQRTIARELNLSTATVCRSLKNDLGIRAETRARVTSMAKKLGYQQRSNSRLEADSRAGTNLTHLGVLLASSSKPGSRHHLVHDRVLYGMSEAARSFRASIHVAYVPEGDPAVADLVNRTPMVSDRAVSALALLGVFPRDVVASLAEQFSVVRLVHHDPAVPTDCVNQDDLGAVAELVRHLVKLGHRKIGFASCDSIRHRSYVQARFGGYVSALAMAGLTYDPALCIGVDDEIAPSAVVKRIKPLITRGATAWICVHDGLGYEVLRGLTESGVRVPDDVALCGFDNLEPPTGQSKLTTMDAPFESMGMAMVSRLMDRLKHPAAEPVQLMFFPKLIEGLTASQVGLQRSGQNKAS